MFLSNMYIKVSAALLSCTALLGTVSMSNHFLKFDMDRKVSSDSRRRPGHGKDVENISEDILSTDKSQDKVTGPVEEATGIVNSHKEVLVGSGISLTGLALFAGNYYYSMLENTSTSENRENIVSEELT